MIQLLTDFHTICSSIRLEFLRQVLHVGDNVSGWSLVRGDTIKIPVRDVPGEIQ
jgi:hypothetical protein